MALKQRQQPAGGIAKSAKAQLCRSAGSAAARSGGSGAAIAAWQHQLLAAGVPRCVKIWLPKGENRMHHA